MCSVILKILLRQIYSYMSASYYLKISLIYFTFELVLFCNDYK